MKQYTEDDIQEALDAIAKGISIKRAASNCGIPRSTLQERLSGRQPHQQASASQQRLSPTQEDHLAQWVLTQAALGLPPTHSQLKEFAQRVLDTQGDPQPLGKRWIQGFLRRNPSLKTQRSQSIDSHRASNASTDTIKPWFRYLEIPAIKAIKPANRYNMDEASIMEGQGSNGLVLGSRQIHAV